MEFFLLTLLVIALGLGAYLTHKYGAKFYPFNLNFATWYYLVEFFIMSALSVFFIHTINPNIWALRMIPPEDFPKIKVILSLIWCAIALPLGHLLANFILQKLKLESNYQHFLVKKVSLNNSYIQKIILFSSVIIGIFCIYLINQIGYIPQVSLFSMNKTQIAILRGSLTHNFPANIYLFELIAKNILPIMTFTSFTIFLNQKNKRNMLIFIIFLAFFIFTTTINLNKSSLAYLIIGLFITYSIYAIRISLKKILLLGMAIFASLAIFFALINPHISFGKIAKEILHRTTISQSYGNYLSFHIFPKIRPHIGLNSSSRLIKKFGFKYQENAARQIMRFTQPDKVENGTAGYMVSIFFAEAWANFGLLGIILSPLYVGFFIKFLIGLLINLEKTPLTIGIISFTSYSLGINQGFNQILIPRYLILSLIILIGPPLYQAIKEWRSVHIHQ